MKSLAPSFTLALVHLPLLTMWGCAPPPDDSPTIAEQTSAQTLAAHPNPLVHTLETATTGLLFTSESDYPLDVVFWRKPGGHPTGGRVGKLSGQAADTPVEERNVDDFFEVATTPQPWHSPEEQESVRRYQALVRILKSKLTHIRVFRYGSISIQAYVVGVTEHGDWAGVSTIQIET